MDNHDASVIIENGPNNFEQFHFKIELFKSIIPNGESQPVTSRYEQYLLR